MNDKETTDIQKAHPNALKAKVAEWLQHEGYPLEYITAATFYQAGFGVHQGLYVRSGPAENPREVDVVASHDCDENDLLIRIEYVVECKWSREKPWVVFTSPFRRMSAAACINQTIASEFGEAALWLQAGDPRLAQLSTFATPRVPGFGGRQALSQAKDTFYGAVQAVVSASTSIIASYGHSQLAGVSLPESLVIAFPVVVVDGDLFETFPTAGGHMDLRQVESSRLHWTGSAAWSYHATVDIVTLTGLTRYAKQRADEVDTIIKVLKAAAARITKFARSGKRSDLRITQGSRGTLGTPPLIRRLMLAHRDAKIAARERLEK